MKTLLVMPHTWLAKFADRVKVSSHGCWLWTGSVNHAGYPTVCVKLDGKWQNKRLTRLVCEEIHGPLGDLEACHTCNVRRCVRPDHLVPGTHQENIAAKQVHGTHHKGERNPMAKLTAEDVQAIRGMAGKVSQREIGKQFCVSQSAVSRIIKETRW